MTFVEHLSDLRKRIIYVCIVFVLLMAASLVFVAKIYSYLVSPLAREGYKLMVTSPGEVIGVHGHCRVCELGPHAAVRAVSDLEICQTRTDICGTALCVAPAAGHPG